MVAVAKWMRNKLDDCDGFVDDSLSFASGLVRRLHRFVPLVCYISLYFSETALLLSLLFATGFVFHAVFSQRRKYQLRKVLPTRLTETGLSSPRSANITFKQVPYTIRNETEDRTKMDRFYELSMWMPSSEAVFLLSFFSPVHVLLVGFLLWRPETDISTGVKWMTIAFVIALCSFFYAIAQLFMQKTEDLRIMHEEAIVWERAGAVLSTSPVPAVTSPFSPFQSTALAAKGNMRTPRPLHLRDATEAEATPARAEMVAADLAAAANELQTSTLYEDTQASAARRRRRLPHSNGEQ
jgi:hypothetical protein